jgi:FkbM family methyltransferase
LTAVDNAIKAKLLGPLRRAVGFDATAARLDAMEARLDSMERAVRPNGPVYLGENRALVATRWGAKMVVDTRDSLLAPWLLMDGLWESHVTGWFHDTLRGGQVFVDVGANIGYFTLLGARLVGPTGRVVAVEAHGGLFDILRRNVIINGYRQTVETVQVAAWSAPARLKFHQRANYLANSSLGPVGASGLADLGDTEEDVYVDARPLDEILGAGRRVDVIKVDVEGAEVHAFQGLAQTLAANPAIVVLFEWSPEQLAQVGNTREELVDLLAGHGLGFRLIEDGLASIDRARLLDLPYGNVVATKVT